MKGAILVKKLGMNAPYYCDRGYNGWSGGGFWRFITPFFNEAGQGFYFVNEMEQNGTWLDKRGRLAVEGELHIITTLEVLRKRKADAVMQLGSQTVRYYWRSRAGTIVDSAYTDRKQSGF